MKKLKILTISGSLRANSSNTNLLRAAIKLAPPELELIPYTGLGDIPPFNPDHDVEPALNSSDERTGLAVHGCGTRAA